MNIDDELRETAKAYTGIEETAELIRVAVRRLVGAGLGFVDVHLLAAVQLKPDAILWLRDRALAGIANRLMLN